MQKRETSVKAMSDADVDAFVRRAAQRVAMRSLAVCVKLWRAVLVGVLSAALAKWGGVLWHWAGGQ